MPLVRLIYLPVAVVFANFITDDSTSGTADECSDYRMPDGRPHQSAAARAHACTNPGVRTAR